jgi:hypothetical protein
MAHDKINIYYHMALFGNYEEVIKNTLNKIANSNLYIEAESINVGMLRKNHSISFDGRPKIKVVYESDNFEEFEYPTLSKLHEHAIAEDGYFLYIHTKGVSDTTGGVCSRDWRNYMEYFTIENWRTCTKLLEEYDTVGVNYKNDPYKHYSGNFWWAKSSYLRTLPKIKKTSRFDCEAWIGSGDINACSLHNSNLNHYHTPYPESCYKRSIN